RGYYPDPGGSESAFGAVFRLNLLLSNPARVPPTAADIVRALEAAGFCRVQRFPLTPRSTCFVASARA
ncbi:MAG: hypothetical protein HC882_02845, partial [Acidobacteria bacterium]|nr:hypothetical protein [Acidobacteriota bacterium]